MAQFVIVICISPSHIVIRKNTDVTR